MSKAVLISIRPRWCEKIVNGNKTIEVRKTRPKLDTPFKCYIYCTLQGCNEFFRVDLGGDVAKWNRGKWWDRKGKVIGEFTCDRVYELETKARGGSYYVKGKDRLTACEVAQQSCLTLKDMHDYLHAQTGYGWHITDLRIYDAPRELSEFRRACPNSWYCESCAMYWENNGTCGNESLQLKRAPQSWCYVEEVRDE